MILDEVHALVFTKCIAPQSPIHRHACRSSQLLLVRIQAALSLNSRSSVVLSICTPSKQNRIYTKATAMNQPKHRRPEGRFTGMLRCARSEMLTTHLSLPRDRLSTHRYSDLVGFGAMRSGRPRCGGKCVVYVVDSMVFSQNATMQVNGQSEEVRL